MAASRWLKQDGDLWLLQGGGGAWAMQGSSPDASVYLGNFVPIWLAPDATNGRVPCELVLSTNPNGAVPCRVIEDTRAAVPVVVTADRANGLMPIFLV